MSDLSHYSQGWSHRTPKARRFMWTGWAALVALFVWCWQLMTRNIVKGSV